MFDRKLFGKTIRKMRENQHFTLVGLSLELNITHSYLGEIERGIKAPSVEVALSIANFFKIGLDDSSLKLKKDQAIVHEILNKINSLNSIERQFIYKALTEFIAFHK